jgi:hypothetical protein
VVWQEEVEPQTKVAGGEDWNGMRLCGNTDVDVADRFGGVGDLAAGWKETAALSPIIEV